MSERLTDEQIAAGLALLNSGALSIEVLSFARRHMSAALRELAEARKPCTWKVDDLWYVTPHPHISGPGTYRYASRFDFCPECGRVVKVEA